MKIFLSWSGDRSKAFAIALKEWLPDVLQGTAPWMSEQDIAAGSRWQEELNGVLREKCFGILCVTPENQKNPWLIFEAGALSRTIDQSAVVPLLLGMGKSQLEPPLSQFQAILSDKDGFRKLVESMNQVLETPLSPDRLIKVFEKFWPDLEAILNPLKATPTGTSKPKERSERDMIEEILELTRKSSRETPNIPKSIRAQYAYDKSLKCVTVDFTDMVEGVNQRQVYRVSDTIAAQDFLMNLEQLIEEGTLFAKHQFSATWDLIDFNTRVTPRKLYNFYHRDQFSEIDPHVTLKDLGISNGKHLQVIPKESVTLAL